MTMREEEKGTTSGEEVRAKKRCRRNRSTVVSQAVIIRISE